VTDVPLMTIWPVKLQDTAPATTTPNAIWPLDVIVPVPFAGEVTVRVLLFIVAVTVPERLPLVKLPAYVPLYGD
jgi:hypothetical protein